MSLNIEKVREFVIAAHGNLDKVKEMAAADPELIPAEYDWGDSGLEDGLGAAAHVGNRPIAEFFLSQGIPSNICVAGMLGDLEAVQTFLANNPALANARGAHGIPLMYHAAQSGNLSLLEALKAAGCNEGYNNALHAAISHKHPNVVRWLLDNGVTDANIKNFQNKTPLQHAMDSGETEAAELLRTRGGTA